MHPMLNYVDGSFACLFEYFCWSDSMSFGLHRPFLKKVVCRSDVAGPMSSCV